MLAKFGMLRCHAARPLVLDCRRHLRPEAHPSSIALESYSQTYMYLSSLRTSLIICSSVKRASRNPLDSIKISTMAQYPSGADKLIPKDPSSCEVIRQVTPQITTVSAPFARFGLFKVGSRATIGGYLHTARSKIARFLTALQSSLRTSLSPPSHPPRSLPKSAAQSMPLEARSSTLSLPTLSTTFS